MNKFILSLCLLVTFGGNLSAMDLPELNPVLDAAMINAARIGDFEILEYWLTEGVQVDAKDEHGCTALMEAAANGHGTICKLLLKHKAQINTKNNGGWTALISAAICNYDKICELLLENNAQVDAKDYLGCTALMWAASRGCTDTCKLLLKNKARIDEKNNKDCTPLKFAASYGNGPEDTCELLIDVMLKPTKEQRDSVVTLLGCMKKIKRSKDERFLLSRSALREIIQQNKPKAFAEIAKIENKTLKNELIQYVQNK